MISEIVFAKFYQEDHQNVTYLWLHISVSALDVHRAATCNFILMLETCRMCGIIVKQPEFAHHQSSGYILTTAC